MECAVLSSSFKAAGGGDDADGGGDAGLAAVTIAGVKGGAASLLGAGREAAPDPLKRRLSFVVNGLESSSSGLASA